MKCPKCDYLGFDTGERCRNCGYDFSLIAIAPAAASEVVVDPDLPLRPPPDVSPEPLAWREKFDRSLGSRPHTPVPRGSRAGDSALPLFSPASADDDEPLIKVPAAPRPPLSVRRTPESAAVRRAAKDTPPAGAVTRRASSGIARPADEPTLGFGDDVSYTPSEPTLEESRPVRTTIVVPPRASGVIRRVIAVFIDHAILLGIDATVIYFTLRLVSLTWSDWPRLSPLPLATFLVLIKLAYFAAFTALGGQTIGKMAAHIRVVSEQGRFVDPRHAVGRALAGVLSLLTLGIGFLPALLTPERRALHDRLAHTRVVSA